MLMPVFITQKIGSYLKMIIWLILFHVSLNSVDAGFHSANKRLRLTLLNLKLEWNPTINYNIAPGPLLYMQISFLGQA